MSSFYCRSLVSNIRAHSDPTHQHFGPSLPGHHLQNSYTQTGSFHVISDGLITKTSALNSSLHQMVCSSAMDCESPVTSTTGQMASHPALSHHNYHNQRFGAKAWAPITPQNSLQSPPNSLQSPPLYTHHSSSHHMRLNNVSNGTVGSNSQHTRAGPVGGQQTFRQSRHHSSQHTPQHTSSVGSIGKPHQQLTHSAPSLQVAAISSSCPSASSTSSHNNPSSTLVLDALSQSLHKSSSMTSPPSSGSSSDFSVPMDTSAGQLIPAFIQTSSTFQSLPTFQATPYQTSGQSLFMSGNFQFSSGPNASINATVSPKHSVFNPTHPSLGSPAITSSTLSQQQRQHSQTGLVESVLKRSRQSYAPEEVDREDTSPMVHDSITSLAAGQHSIGRPQH